MFLSAIGVHARRAAIQLPSDSICGAGFLRTAHCADLCSIRKALVKTICLMNRLRCQKLISMSSNYSWLGCLFSASLFQNMFYALISFAACHVQCVVYELHALEIVDVDDRVADKHTSTHARIQIASKCSARSSGNLVSNCVRECVCMCMPMRVCVCVLCTLGFGLPRQHSHHPFRSRPRRLHLCVSACVCSLTVPLTKNDLE